MPLLDVMANDVLLCCRSCGVHQACYFRTGLQLFQHTATYSSAGELVAAAAAAEVAAAAAAAAAAGAAA
jgi:hypothetical protein